MLAASYPAALDDCLAVYRELLAVRPPEPLATFLDLNGYLPIGVPMPSARDERSHRTGGTRKEKVLALSSES